VPRADEAAGAPSAAGATVLQAVRTAAGREGVVVTLRGDGRLVPAAISEAQDPPPRLVLDLPGVEPAVAGVTAVNVGPVARIRVAANSRRPLVTRVVIDLTRPTAYRVEPPEGEERDLRVIFPLEAGSAMTPASVGAPTPSSGGAAERAATVVLDPMAALRLADGPPPAATLLLDQPGIGPSTGSAPTAGSDVATGVVPTAPAAENQGVAATPGGPPSVSVGATAPVNGAAAATAAPAAASLAGAGAPTSSSSPSGGATPGPLAGAPGEAPPAPPSAQPPPQPLPPATPPPAPPAQPPARPETQVAPGQRQYTGFPISLDFQSADLRSVLRTFAEITGLNIVIDPAVQGTVDVALRDVPWDQALEIILRANKLGYIVDGTVVRIAPLTVLADEEAQRRKLAEEQALAGQLHVLTRTLSYARAAQLRELLTRTVLSQRGQVQVDERTNTLIITDLQERLTSADDLIRTLDRPEPQVEIEARIVQTTRDFARALGVQWGLNGRVAPDLGNTTPLAFPNRGTVSGRTGVLQGPADPRATALEQTGTAVNLPVTGATSAVGLALGAVNGAFNLDMALSALERQGRGRILSAPRVTTQNNVAAEMTQGVQIPIQTVANNTVTVTFKDAALTLRVTPQITAANTIVMNIALENAAPDFSRQVGGIPPIDTQRANTTVQVNDGQTTVIGGIFVSREQAVSDRTPGLHRLPLIGWLFRREDLRDESRELLIFITPRIIR
jgi:type IV pilus assembly protein PilQ